MDGGDSSTGNSGGETPLRDTQLTGGRATRHLDRHPQDQEWGHAHGPGADGIRVHYVRRGRGEPVVLLHGWPGFWYDWRRVIVTLGEEVDVVALDFRGFGDSDKPEGDPKEVYAPERLAADVLALLDHLGVGRFVATGHDTGAVIAQVLARRIPERLSALALFNPPHSAIGEKPQEPGAQRESWYHHFHALPWSHELVGHNRDTIELYLRHFYDHWVGNKESVRPKEFEAIVDTFARPGALGASFGWYRATYEEETGPSARATEGPILIPTVVRWGELDPVKPPSWAEGIEETFPNLDFRFVGGAGHFVPFEAPEETVAAVRTALSMAR
jgi:pimeloyl-ACP methyl ester carboxylesterase